MHAPWLPFPTLLQLDTVQLAPSSQRSLHGSSSLLLAATLLHDRLQVDPARQIAWQDSVTLLHKTLQASVSLQSAKKRRTVRDVAGDGAPVAQQDF